MLGTFQNTLSKLLGGKDRKSTEAKETPKKKEDKKEYSLVEKIIDGISLSINTVTIHLQTLGPEKRKLSNL